MGACHARGLNVVVVAIATVFHGPLMAWLTKRLAKGLERDAERYKHELSREMEKYKDELTRAQSVERLRAEMRKVVSETLFEKRLAAYQELYKVIIRVPATVLARAMLAPGTRGDIGFATEQIQALNDTLEQHLLYVSGDFAQRYRSLTATLTNMFSAATWDTTPRLDIQDERVTVVHGKVRTLQGELEQLYKTLPDDLANGIAQ